MNTHASAVGVAVGVVLGAIVAAVALWPKPTQTTLVLPPPLTPSRDPYGAAIPEPAVDVNARTPTLAPPMATRGAAPSYAQVGILTKLDEDPDADKAPTILPLFGRPTYPGSQVWAYYAASDKFHVNKLPVITAKRECSKDPGCPQLWDHDRVRVPAYKSEFEVTLYNT